MPKVVFDRGEDPDVIYFEDGFVSKKSGDLGAILDPNSIRTGATPPLTLETFSELIDKLEASLPSRMEIRSPRAKCRRLRRR